MPTNAESAAPKDVDDYIAGFAGDVRRMLLAMRDTIRSAAPLAEEKISYRMPTFALHGNLVHFAAFKGHIGFYPGASGVARFAKELARYEGAKGSVRFPFGEPIPHDLIERIVTFRVKENLDRARARRKKK